MIVEDFMFVVFLLNRYFGFKRVARKKFFVCLIFVSVFDCVKKKLRSFMFTMVLPLYSLAFPLLKEFIS